VVLRKRAKNARLSLLAIPVWGVLLIGGCQSGQASASGRETPVTEMMRGMGTSGAVDQLDFFDALEKRSTVTWDELLAGVLLAAGKRADGSYEDRLGWSRRAGILGSDTPPGATALANSGDLAKVLLRAQGTRLRAGVSGEEALALASRRKLLPSNLDPRAALTGPITVGALSAVGQPTGARPSPNSSSRTTVSVPTHPTPPTSGGGSEP
jgi:hypothetical protein